MSQHFESDHLELPEDRSPEALQEHGEQLALNELLWQAFERERQSGEGEPHAQRERMFPKSARVVHFPAIVAMAACLALLGVLVWVLVNDNRLHTESIDSVSVASVSGEVLILPAGGVPAQLSVGDLLEFSGCMTTGGGASVELIYPDGTQIILAGNSELQGNWGSLGAKQLNLLSGRLELDVMPQPAGQPLLIATPYAKAQVLGTRLVLNIKEDYTEMTVDEGVVGFQREADAKPLLVQAGFVAELGPELARLEANDTSQPEVLNFTLISVATGQPVAGYDPIEEGAAIPISELPFGGVNIRVNTVGRIRDMVIKSSHEPAFVREQWPPYSVAGDDVQFGGDYHKLTIQPETYHYDVTPIDVNGARGRAKQFSIQFVQ